MDGVPSYPPEDVKKYKKLHLWCDMTLGESLERIATINYYRVMAADEKKKLTYSQLNQESTRLALGFLKAGFRPGDIVIMQMPNVVEFCVVFFALQKIGVVPIMGIPRHGLAEMTYFGNAARPVAWIGPSVYHNTDYMEMVSELKKKVPSLKYIVTVDEEPEKSGTISYQKLLAQVREGSYAFKDLEKYSPHPDEPAALIPTGGTTGLPKLVPVTHNVYLCRADFCVKHYDRSASDVNLVVTPLSHDAGLVRLFVKLTVGGKIVLGSSTKPPDIMELIQRERVTNLFLVPALVIDFINYPERGKYDLSSLKVLKSGGAFMPPEVHRQARDRLGCLVFNGLGMAEGIYIGNRLDYPLEEVMHTIGKPFCPWNTVKIIDDLEREVPQGEEGELAGKGPEVFPGYYKSEEANKRVFTKDGFYRTGDMCRVNERGNFILTGRKKDLINRGGEKINAEQVEEMVITMKGVVDVAAVAMPDARLGEKVCIYIKAREGYNFDLDKVTSHMKSLGASVLLLPERVETIGEMPLTAIGKIDKKILRQRIAEKIQALQ